MALSWVLLVVVFALNNGFSEAANNTTTTTAAPATPTTSLVPLTTQNPAAATSNPAETTSNTDATTSPTAVPSSTASPSTASPSGFYMYLKGNFTSSECTAANDDWLNSTLKTIYTDAVFDLKNISLDVKKDKCQYHFTITFGPECWVYNISEVLIDKIISLSDTLKLTNLKTELYVPAHGVTLGHFEVKADDCKRICYDGAGGEIKLYRNCTPESPVCERFKLEMEVSNCMKFCSDGSFGVMCKISLLVLFFGVFMNWLLK